MEKRPFPQEVLKLIACAAMLLDHIGGYMLAEFIPFRIVGRIAFPLYCFLLAEGTAHTKSPVRYLLRLLVCAVISELPFDLCLSGRLTWQNQSVIVTLLLGAAMAFTINKAPLWLKPLIVLPYALLAVLFRSDYGAMGIVIIGLFLLTRQMPHSLLLQAIGLFVIQLCFSANNVQHCALAAMIPISLYSGQKVTHRPIVQWSFYLFYPVHLLILWLIRVI